MVNNLVEFLVRWIEGLPARIAYPEGAMLIWVGYAEEITNQRPRKTNARCVLVAS